MNHYERQKEELQLLHDQALDTLDGFANEYHISDGTVYAIRMDFERAFGKLKQIHQYEGEINELEKYPTTE